MLQADRRKFLGSLAGAAFAPAAIAHPAFSHPAAPDDQRLISLAREFIHLAEQDEAGWEAMPDKASNAVYDAQAARSKEITHQLEDLADQIRELPAHTDDGRRWKARCALSVAPREANGTIMTDGDMAADLTWSLMAELAGNGRTI